MTSLEDISDNPVVVIEAGASFEFLMSLATACGNGEQVLAEVGPAWLAAVRERAGEPLMAALRDLAPANGDLFVHLIPFAHAASGRSVESLLERLRQTDASELLLRLAGYHDQHMRRRVTPEVMLAAVAGDDAAKARLIARFDAAPEWQPFFERHLGSDPEDFKQQLLAALEGWQRSVWPTEEARLLPTLECEASIRRRQAQQLPFERFVESTTNGVRFAPRPDIAQMVMIPTVVRRPFVSYAENDGTLFVVFPVAADDIGADPDAPSPRLLRLAKALGDEKRLRVLRALATKPHSLGELAERFQVPKTSMHHHMVVLRAAGLVSVDVTAHEYRLRSDSLPALEPLLERYLQLDWPAHE